MEYEIVKYVIQIQDMGKCSYVLIDRDEKEGRIEKSCPHETWEGSNKFCIFHDPSLDKDRDLFIQKLEEQMQIETEIHSFVGYIFPENWNYFKNYKFKIPVDFNGAIFQNASFRNATFQKDADFRETTFRDLTMNGTVFKENLDFKPKQVKNLDLRNSKFFFMGMITTSLKMAKFHNSFLKKCFLHRLSMAQKNL